ncbi:MAG: triphosphoribosyl-dephospho-CoA synthase [Planctomycetaceae bacterium]
MNTEAYDRKSVDEAGFPLEARIRQACRLEVYAEKPGNVSPSFCFDNAGLNDFLQSADVVAPILAESRTRGVGRAIFDAVTATQQAIGHNTNLGIILLLAPLAAVPLSLPLRVGIADILTGMGTNDAELLYRAIRAAAPGGLGNVEEQDVNSPPTLSVIDCMRLAADRDLIAAQFTGGYQQVLVEGCDLLQSTSEWTQHHDRRLGWLALELLSRHGDSLILRKCGSDMNSQVSRKAQQVLRAGWPHQSSAWADYDDFDAFLRTDGHRRNPGTTADIIAAVLFAMLRDHGCQSDADETQLIFPKVRS